MEKNDRGKTNTGSNNLSHLRSHSIKNSISSLYNQLELKIKAKVGSEKERRAMTPAAAYESLQVKMAAEKLTRFRRSTSSHKGDGDTEHRTPAKTKASGSKNAPNAPWNCPKPVSKNQPSSTSTVGMGKRQPQQPQPPTHSHNGRFSGAFPKLDSKGQSQTNQANPRPKSKPLQSIQLRTSLHSKDNINSINNNYSNTESSLNSNMKTEKRISKPSTAKAKVAESCKVNKTSPYKNQLPSIYSQGSRPRSRQVKDSNNNTSIDETVPKPIKKWSNINRLDKFESMYHIESLPKIEINRISSGDKVQKLRDTPKDKISHKFNASSNKNSSEKMKTQTQVPSKGIIKATPLKSPTSSRQPAPAPITNRMDSGQITSGGTNFAAVLVQTTKIIEGALECTAKHSTNNNDPDFPNSTQKNTDEVIIITKAEVPKVDNIDNLPYPINPGVEGQNSHSDVINPPVNTPVSPRSPISDPTDTDTSLTQLPVFTKNSKYSDDEDKAWSKDTEMDHDFVSDYLQLESMKEVNSVTQAMCRANICREIKGADPNLTLEELKSSKSHYLQIPCFADANFFTKIKIPPNIFMNGKRPDKDLITIQYLQEKMDHVYQNNLKAFEALRKSKPVQTDTDSSGKDLNQDTALSKERYIQSLSKLFQSLQLPQWAKECFGSDEEGIPSSARSAEEDPQLKYTPTDSSTDRSALAKRILNLFDNGKVKQLNNVDNTSRLKKATFPKDCDDDTSSDNISESP